jgi:hypothetical protein
MKFIETYLSALNIIVESISSSKGQNIDSLYNKIIEGREQGINFIKHEPSINHITKNGLADENKLLYEHCLYLINLSIEAKINNIQFSTLIQDDITRTLRILYENQRRDQYFGKAEEQNAIYYVFTDSIIDFIIDKALNNHLELLWYDQKICARNFVNAWMSFIQEAVIEEAYNSNSELTSKILGNTKGNVEISNDEKSFYSHLQNQMEVELWPYREDKFSDVSIYSKEKFHSVFSLEYDIEKRKDILRDKHKNWFKDCLITIEHENNYLDAFTEMMYLTYRRARLKVLITYYDDVLENIKNIFTVMCTNFGNIIRQSNLLFSENQKTEYLFIVGSKFAEKKYTWNIQTFNWCGQWTKHYIF